MDNERDKPRLHISRVIAIAGALLIAAAAGAAVTADLSLKEDIGARIYSATVTQSAVPAAVSLSVTTAPITAARTSAAADTGTTSARTSRSAAHPAVTSKASVTTRKTASSKKTLPSEPTDTAAVRETAVSTVTYSYPQDLNLADFDCLTNVSGINRTAAEGIIARRNRQGTIHSFDELTEIYGIGERTLAVIKEHFYISERDLIITTVRTEPAAESTAPPTQTTAPQTTAPQTTAPEKPAAVTDPTTTASAAASEPAHMTAAAAQTAPPQEEEPRMKKVNINRADAQQLCECLLLSPELADSVIGLRQRIGRFSDPLELLYTDGFSQSALTERLPFILLSDEPADS